MQSEIRQFQGDYRFLSNFWLCKVNFQGFEYPSVENAYQAAKTMDLNHRACFVELTAGQAKREGRKITLRPDWEEVKYDIMHFLVTRKFLTNPELAKKLKDTGSAELIEGNSWGDCYWGVDLATNSGANNLGKILMEVRDIIQTLNNG